jgi:hypothetical protein
LVENKFFSIKKQSFPVRIETTVLKRPYRGLLFVVTKIIFLGNKHLFWVAKELRSNRVEYWFECPTGGYESKCG